MKSKKIIFALAMSLLLFNCSSDSSDDLQDDEDQQGMNPDVTITYDANIRSIMSNNCTQCHGSTPTNGAPFSLSTFDQVKGRIGRIIARTNSESNPMPRSGLMPIALRDMIKQWEVDGLLEN